MILALYVFNIEIEYIENLAVFEFNRQNHLFTQTMSMEHQTSLRSQVFALIMVYLCTNILLNSDKILEFKTSPPIFWTV